MKFTKVILNESGKVELLCPHCSVRYRSGSFRFAQYVGQRIKTRCRSCGERFGISVEKQARRKYARKKINSSEVPAAIFSVFAAIDNLSRTGVRFFYHDESTSRRHKIGDRIVMSVQFPGYRHGDVDCELEVVSVSDHGYGCKILNAQNGSRAGKAIGFYLLDVAQREKGGNENG